LSAQTPSITKAFSSAGEQRLRKFVNQTAWIHGRRAAAGLRRIFVKHGSCVFGIDDEKYFPEDRQHTVFLFCTAAII
jgi:hypothetical protein